MGQQLFKVHFDIVDNTVDNSEIISSDPIKDDIRFFFPLKFSSDSINNQTELNNDQQISKSQIEYIKQIQNSLFRLTKSVHWGKINTEINEILMNNIFTSIIEQNKKIMKEIENHLVYKQHLQTSLINKLKEENDANLSIFEQPFIDASSENNDNSDNQEEKTKYQPEQLSYFAIESLTSILLILIQSVEKNDPIIIHKILTLISRLCEQLPMKCLSTTNNFLFKSLEPLIYYIHELSLTTDPIITKQAIKIQLNFSIAKGSFKDILSLLKKLIFNTTDIYNVQTLFLQLNKGLTETINKWEKQKKQLTNEEKIDSNSEQDDNTISKELTGQL
ncbi:unnamed protein product [Rotaria sordida]|uniref:Uncharacterized protein n=1 Tax=Rotaria sordida TaxID=392033 RepID=A0A815WI68_9BILA|nr:unnamed protein product [Rotaria sordida]CAF1545114.1 unnamed protein product [Rotaria sordida]